MNIVFRVDASIIIGTGHVMRCITLADLMREKSAQVFFVCASLEGNLNDLIMKKGYRLFSFSTIDFYSTEINTWDWQSDAVTTFDVIHSEKVVVDWLIIDHYGLDHRWEQKLQEYSKKIMVIDDLANREHDCDLLLDQNYYKNKNERYDGLVSPTCKRFLGPEYALLRTEFWEIGQAKIDRDGRVRRILVFFSGSDPTNETLKALDALMQIDRSMLHIDVVVGQSNPNREDIRLRCEELSDVYYHCQVENIAEMMANADLAIGAGGVTMWERCYLGLPAITIIIADNQRETTEAVAEYGAIWNLGWHELVTSRNIADTINKAINSPLNIQEMSKRALQLLNPSNDQKSKGVEYLVETIMGDRYIPE